MIIQTEQLLTLGVPEDRIYIDRGFSGTTRSNRAGLDQALAAVWEGSVFTVTKVDRFARNMAEANQILTDLSGRRVLFGLSASVHDWNDPFGRLFLQTLAMVAEFEANLGHMRTREGMAMAKKNGKLKGRQAIQTDLAYHRGLLDTKITVTRRHPCQPIYPEAMITGELRRNGNVR